MPASRLRSSISIITAIVLLSSFAYAQPKPAPRKPLSEQLTGDAKKHFDAGVTLGTRKQWDAARTEFQAAWEGSKNPRVLFNVAIAERELGRYAAAIDTFKRELAEGKGQLSADEESEIRAVMTALEKYVAQLTIVVNEPGAEVFVDNDKIAPSALSGPISVPVGERRIRATKPGFADATESVQLAGGAARTVNLTLVPLIKTSLVVVAVDGPPNAVIKVDGKEVGSATPAAPYQGRVVVSEEKHQFSAEAPGFVTATAPGVVRDKETLTLRLVLSPEQQKGKLVVNAKPDGATIEIDGKAVGATHWEGPVDAGTHQVVVKKQGFYTWSYDVDVPKGGERPVTASLNEDRNTSFVPWLIGTIVVIGGASVAAFFIAQPKDEDPVPGNLAPNTVGTSVFRFR
jgi:hypothetical protein